MGRIIVCRAAARWLVEQVPGQGEEVRHSQRRTSLVLVTRRQVQPVSLQTRSSPAPGALWL